MRLLLALLITVTTLAAGDAPEIAVARTGANVPDGGSDTVLGTIQTMAFSQTWTIANEGAVALTLGTPVIAAMTNCSAGVTTPPALSVAANASTSLVLQFTPSAATWSFTVSLVTNDSDENPMNWTVSGNADASATVEVGMVRAGANVGDGATDNITGSTASVAETLTYTIQNLGSAQLNLSNTQLGVLSNATAIILTPPASTVAVGATTHLVLRVTPGVTPGGWSVPIDFTSNDSDEITYNWTVAGTSILSNSDANIVRGGVAITDGATYNGPGGTANSAMDLTFTIENSGSSTLSVSTPTISSQSNCTATLVLNPSSTVSAGFNTNFAIQVTPASNATWTAVVSVGNNDPNENPYDFTIRGTASASGSNGDGDEEAGGGGCGAGAVGGLILALSLLGLRRRR